MSVIALPMPLELARPHQQAWAPSAPEGASLRSAATIPADDELAFVHSAQNGDESAFRVLVERYRDRVYALALRIARDSHAAEEIAQDAFLRAWHALPHFRGDSRFSTWLYRIAYRRALDERAAMDRRTARESQIGIHGLERFETPGTSGDAALRRRLERLVADLPEPQRICLTLFYGADQSIEEIGRVMDVPSGTIKTHLFRGRVALRSEWEREEKGGAE
jgi:RNA polymerase sigma-70 factor (ECF subfamily)